MLSPLPPYGAQDFLSGETLRFPPQVQSRPRQLNVFIVIGEARPGNGLKNHSTGRAEAAFDPSPGGLSPQALLTGLGKLTCWVLTLGMKGRSHQAQGESPILSTLARTPLLFPVWCWDAQRGLADRRGLSGRPPTVQVPVNAHPAPAPYWVLSPRAEFTKPRKVALALSKAWNRFMEELSRPSWWYTALIKTLRHLQLS